MSTVYPSGIDVYTTKINFVDVANAQDLNNLQDAMVAIQTRIGYSGNNNLAPVAKFINEVIPFSGTLANRVFNVALSYQPVSNPILSIIFSGNGQFTTIPATMIVPANDFMPTTTDDIENVTSVLCNVAAGVSWGPVSQGNSSIVTSNQGTPAWAYYSGTSNVTLAISIFGQSNANSLVGLGSGITGPFQIAASYWHI